MYRLSETAFKFDADRDLPADFYDDEVNSFANTRHTLMPKLKHLSFKEMQKLKERKLNPHAKNSNYSRSLKTSYTSGS